MKKYKAIIFDVDGTLIPNKSDGKVTQKNSQAVQKAKKAHVHVSVATSRSPERLSPISDTLKLTGPSIVHGGPRIIDVATKQTLWEKPMSIDSAEEIAAIAYSYNIFFRFNDNGYEYDYQPGFKPVKPYNVWGHKVIPHIFNEFYHKTSHLPEITIDSVPSWEQGKIDFIVTNKAGTKEQGVRELLHMLGISKEDVIGVGDGTNDIPLLKACGLKIAMGNAVAELKAIADYIAPSVEEDGAAHIIEKFLFS